MDAPTQQLSGRGGASLGLKDTIIFFVLGLVVFLILHSYLLPKDKSNNRKKMVRLFLSEKYSFFEFFLFQ